MKPLYDQNEFREIVLIPFMAWLMRPPNEGNSRSYEPAVPSTARSEEWYPEMMENRLYFKLERVGNGYEFSIVNHQWLTVEQVKRIQDAFAVCVRLAIG